MMNDDDLYVTLPYDYQIDTPLKRYNMDSKPTDSNSNKLLELCKTSGIRILNGRSLGDSVGAFTCHSYRGNPSTIDYMLVSMDLFRQVKY